MGYALLWIENLIVSLLLMSLVVACVGRIRRRWLRWALWLPVPLVLLLGYTMQSIFAAVLQLSPKPVEAWLPTVHWFWQMLALALSFVVGAVWLSVFGLRRVDDATTPTVAGGWPRGLLAIVFGAAVALHLTTFSNLELALQRQFEASRAEAGALLMSVAPLKVPDADNAAIIYGQAFQRLHSERWDEISRENSEYAFSPNQGWNFDAKDPGLRPFLRAHAATIALLHKAASKPGCYFQHDYYMPDVGFGMDFAELRGFGEAPALLLLDARMKSADGDARGALQDVNTLFAMSCHISAEPILMSLMQSGPAEHAAVEALQHILSEANVSPDDLAVLHIRDAASFGEVLERVLCSEEAMRLAQFWNFRLDIRGLGPLKHVWQVLLTPYTAADHRQVSFRLRHLAAQPYFESRPQWKDLSEQLTHDVNTSLITRVSVPLLVNYAEIAARWDAIRQAAQLGLAAEQYRFRYDKLPAQLDDLAPEFIPAVPLDPFDGKPMRMKRTEHGLIIYSIGPDMVDDGGAPLALSPDGKLTGDITFELSDGKP